MDKEIVLEHIKTDRKKTEEILAAFGAAMASLRRKHEAECAELEKELKKQVLNKLRNEVEQS